MLSREQNDLVTRTAPGTPGGNRLFSYDNHPCGTMPVGTEPPPVKGFQGRWYVPQDDESHCRFEFIYRHGESLDKEFLRQQKGDNAGPDKIHVRRAENRYLRDRNKMKPDKSFAGLGRYIPAHDAYTIETQGEIQDRTREHLGSTDIVIIEARKVLLDAIKLLQDGGEASGHLRDAAQNQFRDFIYFANFTEDGPAYIRRIFGEFPEAAE